MNWQKVPIFIKQLLALLGGYFWSDCPICGEKFAGFETSDSHYMINSYTGYCVCRNCTAKADELNKRDWKSFLHLENMEQKGKRND